jgi:hypothetical protein
MAAMAMILISNLLQCLIFIVVLLGESSALRLDARPQPWCCEQISRLPVC